MQPQIGYPASLVGAIAAAVHEEGGRLAVHVMGPFVREAVALGVDSIEHGTWADEDTVREMAARGVAWTPTLTTVAHHLEPLAERVPPVRELLDLHGRALRLAAELGVTLLTGTDEQPHGTARGVGALQQRGGAGRESIRGVRRLGAVAASDGGEVVIPHFDRDGTSEQLPAQQPGRGVACHCRDMLTDLTEVGEIRGERAFAA